MYTKAEEIFIKTVKQDCDDNSKNTSFSCKSKIDKFLTGKLTGYPIMLLFLVFIFWLTITGANYPSALLSRIFTGLGEKLSSLFIIFHAPDWLHGMLIDGVYRVLSWVVSVMLPPMAIFFPLFTLLEDSGFLPRIAYNLDRPFQKCRACGKQALCMCMGFGCNAAGVTGCRIIDSPRERLIAILTNSFVPCNGRFPTLIALLTMFFITSENNILNTFSCSLFLTLFILLGILMTFFISWLLSRTLLKGLPSAFILELPPYRLPQIKKVLIRSVFDRTVFVLKRAVIVAAPAGLFLWIMANIEIQNNTLLSCFTGLLDPFGKLLGMDGTILSAFILGFPANEIVMPIILMSYLSQGTLVEINDLNSLKEILISNGWNLATALHVMIFSLFHWPCSTTLITIHKETGSLKWTALAFLLPTLIGIVICFILTLLF